MYSNIEKREKKVIIDVTSSPKPMRRQGKGKHRGDASWMIGKNWQLEDERKFF